MTERLTMRAFHADDRTRDWRVVGDGATAIFRTGSFAAGARLVQAIAAAVGESTSVRNHALSDRRLRKGHEGAPESNLIREAKLADEPGPAGHRGQAELWSLAISLSPCCGVRRESAFVEPDFLPDGLG
jgi:hypothetical protein